MPISLSKIRNDRSTVDVAVAGEQLHFEYFPTRISPTDQEELMQQNDDNDNSLKILSTFIAKVGANWDLVNDDGSPLPIDYEYLRREIPYVLQDRIVKAVMDDMYPNRGSGGSFAAT
jgi:hypothetical protein